jgi:alkylation response protein AidB-like acyl-CoA dehydrogenase
VELQLNDEQAAFVETTRRFLAAECPIASVRALEHEPTGYDGEVWRRAAELGWTSLLVDERDGGGTLSAHGLNDLVLVAEEMGRMVAPGPLVPVNVVAEAVSRLGSDAQRQLVLPGLLAGTEVAAWCGTAPVVAVATDDGYRLSGRAEPVEAGAQARHVLVAFRHDGGQGQALVAVDAPGVTVEPLDGLDLVRRFAAVTFDDVVVGGDDLLGDPSDASAAIERQLQVACVVQCAESVGAIDHVLAMTIEYLGDRYSFGRPLASYQALKHRVADQKLWLEACHAIAGAAARSVAAESDDAGQVVSAAKAWIGPHATELVQDCVQLHGGIGVTWEHDLHLYLRRVTVNRVTYGTPEDHAERVATDLLGPAPVPVAS